jgi:hypothetical protein
VPKRNGNDSACQQNRSEDYTCKVEMPCIIVLKGVFMEIALQMPTIVPMLVFVADFEVSLIVSGPLPRLIARRGQIKWWKPNHRESIIEMEDGEKRPAGERVTECIKYDNWQSGKGNVAHRGISGWRVKPNRTHHKKIPVMKISDHRQSSETHQHEQQDGAKDQISRKETAVEGSSLQERSDLPTNILNTAVLRTVTALKAWAE